MHARLKAEEQALAARETNVQRFGCTWLKPPGVTKTYQAMMDEEMERIEAQMLAAREAERRAMEEAAEADMRRQSANHRPGSNDGVDDEMDGMQRDLDDDVPDAEESTEMDLDDDSQGSEYYTEDDDFINAVNNARDLDDDVPEAGSYQHTDTDVEDLSSIMDPGSAHQQTNEAEEGLETPPASSARRHAVEVVQNFQVPLPIPTASQSGVFNTPSEPADSSMVMSSPIASRPAPRPTLVVTPTAAARRSARTPSRRVPRQPSS